MSQVEGARGARDAAVEHLAALGFTELEAAVYAYLVAHAPATAYRVAHAIGRPVANTYKAVESLRQKGAVIADETAERLCRAVPARELLDALDAAFARRRAAAADALARLEPAAAHDGVFALTTPAQVLDRCTRMIGGAERVVLIDAFPAPLKRLLPALEAAAARGVAVAVQAYAPLDVAGADVVVAPFATSALERWPGQWLCAVADGAEYVFAYLDAEVRTVHQALWSESAFLAWVQHGYLADSVRASLLEHLIAAGASGEALRDALARTRRWSALGARGDRTLRARLAATPPNTPQGDASDAGSDGAPAEGARRP